MRKSAVLISLLVLCGTASVAVEAYRRTPFAAAAAESPQDPMYLDRRITMLEQRFNILESNVSRLQQQAMTPPVSTPQPVRSPDIELLRSELQILKSHLREVHCGVARLDERTLSAAAREARRRGGSQTKDPCREFPDSPIDLTPIR